MLWRVQCAVLAGRAQQGQRRYPNQLWLSESRFLYCPAVLKMLRTLSETFRGYYSLANFGFKLKLLSWVFILFAFFALFLPFCEPWISTVLEKKNTKLLQLWELLRVAPCPLNLCFSTALLARCICATCAYCRTALVSEEAIPPCCRCDQTLSNPTLLILFV